MRSPPPDLGAERLPDVLAEHWELCALTLEYVPEGGGGYHWRLTDAGGRRYFVTVDDLGTKDWMRARKDELLNGLSRALRTSAALRYDAGLQFVIAPIAARDGQPLRPIHGPYTASVFPILPGRSHPFRPYTDARLRNQVLDMIAALHQPTPFVRDGPTPPCSATRSAMAACEFPRPRCESCPRFRWGAPS
jgi:hypothetical protein